MALERKTEVRCERDLQGLCTLRTMVGVMDDSGRLPGLTKFCGGGGRKPGGENVGIAKSFISLLRITPVDGDNTRAPKGKFTVVVMETAFRFTSTMLKWLVP